MGIPHDTGFPNYIPNTYYVTLRGSPHTSQISHLLLYPSLWLLVPGLSSQFCHYFLYNLLLRAALVSNIWGEMATRFCKLREPLTLLGVGTSPPYPLGGEGSPFSPKALLPSGPDQGWPIPITSISKETDIVKHVGMALSVLNGKAPTWGTILIRPPSTIHINIPHDPEGCKHRLQASARYAPPYVHLNPHTTRSSDGHNKPTHPLRASLVTRAMPLQNWRGVACETEQYTDDVRLNTCYLLCHASLSIVCACSNITVSSQRRSRTLEE
jgi:hypothetical protein